MRASGSVISTRAALCYFVGCALGSWSSGTPVTAWQWWIGCGLLVLTFWVLHIELRGRRVGGLRDGAR